ncbi:MAG: hypothetical protein JWO67_3819 [Streptosporangiaceae bacterium]|nr:hypothetical protein [Streptosporangiaceae bacterium]
MATPAMVRAYARSGDNNPPWTYVQPHEVPTPFSSEEMADDYANAWAYNMGYSRAVDMAIRQARWARMMP